MARDGEETAGGQAPSNQDGAETPPSRAGRVGGCMAGPGGFLAGSVLAKAGNPAPDRKVVKTDVNMRVFRMALHVNVMSRPYTCSASS
jgi:hypothetical protein